MPIYEYRCDACGNRFEKIQKFSDAPLVVHEECGGTVERLISSPAFHFKGTGWYATDYAKKNGDGPTAKDGKDAKDAKEEKSGEKAEKKEASDKKSESSDTKKTESGKTESTKTESAAKPAPVAPAASSTAGAAEKK